MVTKLNNSNVTKLGLWQNSRTQIMTTQKSLWLNFKKKLELGQNFKCKKTQFMKTKKLKKGLLARIFWHLDNRWDALWAAFCDSRDVFKV